MPVFFLFEGRGWGQGWWKGEGGWLRGLTPPPNHISVPLPLLVQLFLGLLLVCWLYWEASNRWLAIESLETRLQGKIVERAHSTIQLMTLLLSILGRNFVSNISHSELITLKACLCSGYFPDARICLSRMPSRCVYKRFISFIEVFPYLVINSCSVNFFCCYRLWTPCGYSCPLLSTPMQVYIYQFSY